MLDKITKTMDSAGMWVALHPKTSLAGFVGALIVAVLVF